MSTSQEPLSKLELTAPTSELHISPILDANTSSVTEDLPGGMKLLLINMTFEDIVQRWTELSPIVERSLPPVVGLDPLVMSNILASTQSGAVQFRLFGVEGVGKKLRPLALLTTTLLRDPVMKTKSLFVMTLTGLAQLTDEVWMKGYEMLKHVAKAEQCNQILAYSNVQHVLEAVKRLGGDTSFSLVMFKV